MKRRRYLEALAVAGGAVAGCLGRAGRDDGNERSATATATRTPRPTRVGDVTLPVPTTDMLSAVHRDHIPAITDPAFAADWDDLSLPEESAAETARLPADAPVVGVERGGEARAYPLRILDWHEVVNDAFDGPLLVTYCVQCGSAVVAERTVGGSPTRFGVSGYLWRSDLVLYDGETDSLWSQLLATAINGPATGERLRVLPSALTTWKQWRTDHPGTSVLLPPPASNTVRGRDAQYDYFSPKYGYDDAVLIGYTGDGDRLHPQELVVGVEHDGVARAYPARVVAAAGTGGDADGTGEATGVVTDTVGGRPVVVATAPGDTLVAYDRRIDGRVREFVGDGDSHLRAGGSRWRRSTGVAVDGPFEGTTLRRANELPPLFWLGWSKFHPETTVYGVE
jgi:hypothetical protein